MSTSTPATTTEVTKTPEQLQAEAEEAQRQAEARAAHVAAVIERFQPIMGERVRIHFEDRKMAVPGRLFSTDEVPVGLATNWGLELDLTKEPVVDIETKDLDSGRFTKWVAPAPVAEVAETTETTEETPSDDDES